MSIPKQRIPILDLQFLVKGSDEEAIAVKNRIFVPFYLVATSDHFQPCKRTSATRDRPG
jgi:hypothetical protein